jgi:hypothetical protein
MESGNPGVVAVHEAPEKSVTLPDTAVAAVGGLTRQERRRLAKRAKKTAAKTAAKSSVATDVKPATSTADDALPATDPALPAPLLPQPPSEPISERAENLQRLRSAIASKRTLSRSAKTTLAVSAGKKLVEAYKNNTLTKNQVEQLASMEEELNDKCGGDVELFCVRNGIDLRAIPAIKEALARVEKGSTSAMIPALNDAAKSIFAAMHL